MRVVKMLLEFFGGKKADAGGPVSPLVKDLLLRQDVVAEKDGLDKQIRNIDGRINHELEIIRVRAGRKA